MVVQNVDVDAVDLGIEFVYGAIEIEAGYVTPGVIRRRNGDELHQVKLGKAVRCGEVSYECAAAGVFLRGTDSEGVDEVELAEGLSARIECLIESDAANTEGRAKRTGYVGELPYANVTCVIARHSDGHFTQNVGAGRVPWKPPICREDSLDEGDEIFWGFVGGKARGALIGGTSVGVVVGGRYTHGMGILAWGVFLVNRGADRSTWAVLVRIWGVLELG